MCNCASCEYTDSFASKGFAEWPKGEPKGPAKARAEYASHVAFCKKTEDRAIPPSLLKFTPGFTPDYSWPAVVTPLAEKYRNMIAHPMCITTPQTEEAAA